MNDASIKLTPRTHENEIIISFPMPQSISKERLNELAYADADGRVIILPVKAGDKIMVRPGFYSDKCIEATVKAVWITRLHDVKVETYEANRTYTWGRSAFLYVNTEDIG